MITSRHIGLVALILALTAFTATVSEIADRDPDDQDGVNDHKDRVKRDKPLSDVEFLDAQIAHLLYKIPQDIDTAQFESEKALRFEVAKRVTQGWSIVIGSWKDILSDYVENNRTLGNLGDYTVVYNYGFLAAYGVGFGYPLLLGLPDDTLDCGSADWNYLVNMYRLGDGVSGLLYAGVPASAISSLVTEFNLFAKAKLKCILDRNKDTPEAADVEFKIEQLVEAMTLRADLAKKTAKVTTTKRRSDLNNYITPAAAARSVTVNSQVLNQDKAELAGDLAKKAATSSAASVIAKDAGQPDLLGSSPV